MTVGFDILSVSNFYHLYWVGTISIMYSRSHQLASYCVVAYFLFFHLAIASAYEQLPTVHLTNILSPKLAQSVYHRVDDVEVSGRSFLFRMDSDYGVYNIRSLVLLRIRVNEIATLGHAINQFDRHDEIFSNELRGQLRINAESAIDIITSPVSSATNLAGQIATNLNDALISTPEATPVKAFSYTGGQSVDPVTAMHKRNIASQWGLDVYSTNPKVQEFLNAVAKARSSGHITAGAPQIGGKSGVSTNVTNRTAEAEILFLLKSKNELELDVINDNKLAGMNIRKDIRDEFIQHPFFSPTHKTRITHYLGLLEGVRNRSAFIQAVTEVEDEQQALAYQESVMMLLYYHQKIGPLLKLHAGKDVLQVIAQGNRMLYFAPVDIIFWSQSTEHLFDTLLNSISNAGFNGWELITPGILTKEARAQLEQRRFILREKFVQ